jgi:hypothetical protein
MIDEDRLQSLVRLDLERAQRLLQQHGVPGRLGHQYRVVATPADIWVEMSADTSMLVFDVELLAQFAKQKQGFAFSAAFEMTEHDMIACYGGRYLDDARQAVASYILAADIDWKRMRFGRPVEVKRFHGIFDFSRLLRPRDFKSKDLPAALLRMFGPNGHCPALEVGRDKPILPSFLMK